MSVFADLTLGVALLCIILWLLHEKNKNKDFYKKIPGPPTLPILGNALDFGGSTKAVLNTLQRYTKDYGGIVKVEIGPLRKFILVSDYKFLECILNSMKLLKKSDDYNFFHSWLGTGLLTSDGPKWKKHRKMLTPAFHFQILEQFINVFESCTEKLMQKLEKQCDKSSVDIYPYVTLCALDIIYETTMGISINAQDNENSDYVQSVKTMTKIIVERTISPIQMYDFLYPLTRNYYRQKKVIKILHTHSNNVIKKKLEKLKENSGNEADNNDCNVKKRKVFLDLLLEATVDGRPLTQEEIREEIDTFMFEGHDTTASAISFCLYCLANHAKVQEKAFEEQQTLFGNNQSSTTTYSDLQNMKYLEQVIKECLRLYPSVPVFGRETNEEVEYDGVHLPQGDTVMIFAYGIHRNPKYFKDPDEFNPDRFEEIDGKLPYAYIPFSAGPRNCIGQKFAMLEIKSTVSKIIRKFVLKPAYPEHVLELSVEAILKSANGIKIGLKMR